MGGHVLLKNGRILSVEIMRGGVLVGNLLFEDAAEQTGAASGELSWPDRETNGLAWPKPIGAAKIIHDRFLSASTNALGSVADIEAIKSAIVAAKPRGRVEEIRWLSPRLVIAKVRLMESGYYYVAQKKKDEWEILTYYLHWIS
jgi:hypothetical protein